MVQSHEAASNPFELLFCYCPDMVVLLRPSKAWETALAAFVFCGSPRLPSTTCAVLLVDVALVGVEATVVAEACVAAVVDELLVVLNALVNVWLMLMSCSRLLTLTI